MAGPQDIQRYPTGLIDLLGMRATGQTPSQLAGEISGSIEVGELYLFNRRVTQVGQSPVAIGAVGFLANTTGATVVPQGEMWVLFDCTMRVPVIAAATALNLSLVVQRPADGTSAWFMLTEELRLTASTGGLAGYRHSKPMLLQPGDTFGTYATLVTGVPGSQAFTTVVYSPIKL
jgi:hypothetical protein